MHAILATTRFTSSLMAIALAASSLVPAWASCCPSLPGASTSGKTPSGPASDGSGCRDCSTTNADQRTSCCTGHRKSHDKTTLHSLAGDCCTSNPVGPRAATSNCCDCCRALQTGPAVKPVIERDTARVDRVMAISAWILPADLLATPRRVDAPGSLDFGFASEPPLHALLCVWRE